jgi:hypothetical protein
MKSMTIIAQTVVDALQTSDAKRRQEAWTFLMVAAPDIADALSVCYQKQTAPKGLPVCVGCPVPEVVRGCTTSHDLHPANTEGCIPRKVFRSIEKLS